MGRCGLRLGDDAGIVGEEADKLVRGVGLAQLSQIEALVTFAEALAFLIAEEGEVAEGGWGEAEEAMEVNLLGDGEEKVAPTDDFGDAHECVIDDYCQLIGPGTICTSEDEVATMGSQVDALGAVMEIGESDFFVGNENPRGGFPF